MAAQTAIRRAGAIAAIVVALTATAASRPADAFGPGAVFGILGGLVGTVLRPPAYYSPYGHRRYAERRVVRRRRDERAAAPVAREAAPDQRSAATRLADAARGPAAAASQAPEILFP